MNAKVDAPTQTELKKCGENSHSSFHGKIMIRKKLSQKFQSAFKGKNTSLLGKEVVDYYCV